MTRTPHTRLSFQFDGELDDVPADAAAALARLAHALLRHSDEHDGRSATMRLARLGPLLNLWLTDPECSPACLRGSGHLLGTTERPSTALGDVHLALDPGPGDGLRLHWALVLGPPCAAPRRPTSAQAS
jgi:hypothetical protein